MKQGLIVGLDGQPLLRASHYAGATHGPRAVGVRGSSAGPNRAITGDLATLRNRTRAAYRDSPMTRTAINRNVANEVGTGFVLRSTCDDDATRAAINRLWERQARAIDATGTLDFAGVQALCVRARRTAGEVFIRRRRRSVRHRHDASLAIEVLEADMVPVSLNRELGGNRRIVAGIEFHGSRRVAYWVYDRHPGDGPASGQLLRVPARDMIHHYAPERPGQVRGVPDGVTALLKDKTFADYDDAELIRKRERAAYTGFVWREDYGEEDYQFDPMTGQPLFADSDSGDEAYRVQAGTMLRGSPGERVELFGGDDSGQGYADFIRSQLLQIAAGHGLPYPLLSGDWSGLNDRLVRSMLAEYRREMEMCQNHLVEFQLCLGVWLWMLDDAVLLGLIDAPDYGADPWHYRKMDARPPAWVYAHPTQDLQARQMAIGSNLSNYEQEAAKLGGDLEENMQSNAKSLKRWLEVCEQNGLSQEQAMALFAGGAGAK